MLRPMRKVLLSLIGLVAVVLSLGFFGIGCAAPAYVAGKRVAPAVAAGVSHAEERFDGKQGVKIFSQSWRPTGEPKAVVVLVHGLKDYSDRYNDFAASLVKRGYAVYALDLRGHGDSEGDRVWVDEFADYLDDVDIFLKRVRTAEPGRKIFLYGHSMGGAVVTLYTLTRDPKPAGLITSAAALKTEESGAVTGPVKFLSAIAPKLAVFELKDENFSRDPAVVASMATDPLIYDAKAPARTAAEVLRAIEAIREKSATLAVPVLSMHGTKDLVTPPAGSKELIEAASSTDKTFKSYEGLAHDLVHEPEKQQVMDDVAAWLDLHP
jgi:acylglycerol lipase